VETKRFVSSTVNVILMRQLETCGQRSNRVAESKRWALGNYCPEQIFYTFLMSKCRGVWDLGLCTFWVLVKRESLRNGNFRKKRVSPTGKIGIWHGAVVLFSQVPKKCTDPERWSQNCGVKITFTVLLTIRFVSTTKKSRKCVVNWIPLRIRVRSRNTNPYLEVGLSICWQDVDSQWNPDYKAFHWISFCGNEWIVQWYYCDYDPHVMYMRETAGDHTWSSIWIPINNISSLRETYGQWSSMVAGSKRRALAFDFPVRICYMFLIAKCRKE